MEKEKIYKPCKHEKSCREGNMLICSDCPHGIYDLEKGIDIIENFIENHLERDKLEINEGRGGFKIGQIYKITELNPALSQLLIEYKNLKRENEDSKNIIEKYKNSDYETISLENTHLKEELEKLQDENEVLKRAFYRQSADISNYLLEMQKLEKTIDNSAEEQKEREKYTHSLEIKLQEKDRMINLMAEKIEWLCKSNGILLDKEHNENFTQEDIKEYFEKLAKEE